MEVVRAQRSVAVSQLSLPPAHNARLPTGLPFAASWTRSSSRLIPSMDDSICPTPSSASPAQEPLKNSRSVILAHQQVALDLPEARLAFLCALVVQEVR